MAEVFYKMIKFINSFCFLSICQTRKYNPQNLSKKSKYKHLQRKQPTIDDNRRNCVAEGGKDVLENPC